MHYMQEKKHQNNAYAYTDYIIIPMKLLAEQ